MKLGTVHKTIGGAVAIILVGFIIALWFISDKADSVPEVEIVISSPKEFSDSAAQRRATRKAEIAAAIPDDKEQISAAELQQIEDFFARFEDVDVQSESDESQFSPDAEVAQDTDEHFSDNSDKNPEQPADEVMNEFVEAFKRFDFDAILPFTTGSARKPIENTLSVLGGVLPDELLNDYLKSTDDGRSEDEVDGAVESAYKAMDSIRSPENLAKWRRIFRQTQIVSSEHVGDEFQFRLTVPLPDTFSNFGLDVRMRRINGQWRIYRMES